MSTETVTAGELRARLVEKAAADEGFRARLLADPKAVVEDELGLSIPAGFTIRVHEERADTGHLVLPPAAYLTEDDLEQAAGGVTCRRKSIWTEEQVCTRDVADYNVPPGWPPASRDAINF